MSFYKKLGVRRVINAAFCLTDLGGSRLSKEIQQAWLEANDNFVEMKQLEEKAGEFLAKITGAEAAYVSTGAFSCLTLSAAACITRNDVEKMRKLPHTTGMKNQILVQANLRSTFDRSLEIPGGIIVPVGDKENGCTAEEFEAAINENVVAIDYLAMLDSIRPNTLPLSKIIEIGHKHGVPIIVDAAGQTYPLDRVTSLIAMGSDLVCYSGKYFGGPQSTGFVCGKKEYVDAVVQNSFVGNGSWIGRGYKIDRQEIIALLYAVENWMKMDHEKERLEPAVKRQKYIIENLKGVPGIKCEAQPYVYHVVGITAILDKTPEETAAIVKKFREDDPAIWFRMQRGNSFLINTLMLKDGEEKEIVDKIKATFK
ncbi:aminotransferase class V-fold PLP-dependent enzyme [Candidatus Bathyarchaeota archaeon]|nr:aminotransferase class V-fold PLP-dependent enzyme [Candidatus Bathyarchaeota archaeon]